MEDLSPAMAMDANGALHIAFEQDNITTYMTNASGSWQTTIVGDTQKEFNPSIAVDNAGHVHISYYSGDSSSAPDYDIYYVSNAPDGNWNGSYVTTITDMNTCHSTGGIAVDDAGTPYITYATYDGTLYQIEMRYYDNSRLHSATSGWTTGFSTSSSDHNHPSIAVEGDGTVHLAYQAYSMTDYAWDLEYATNASSSWITTTIPGAAYEGEESPSIAVDAQGKAHIAYINFDVAGYETKYASNASGIWSTETIIDDNLIINDRPAITLDNKGKIHVAIWSYNTDYYISHATNASGSWTIMGMHITDADLTEMDRAIAVDQNGYVHIVHSALAGGDSEIYHAKSDESFGDGSNSQQEIYLPFVGK